MGALLLMVLALITWTLYLKTQNEKIIYLAITMNGLQVLYLIIVKHLGV